MFLLHIPYTHASTRCSVYQNRGWYHWSPDNLIHLVVINFADLCHDTVSHMEEAMMSLLDEVDSSAIFLISRDTMIHGRNLSVTVLCYHGSVVCKLLSIGCLCQPVMIMLVICSM